VVDVNSAFNNTEIDYKILLLIFGIIILFQICLECFIPEFFIDQFVTFLLLPATFFLGCVSLFVAKKHGSSKFGLAFCMLSIGFFLTSIGEIIYYYYFEIIDIDPFPSIADIFFFSIYPFMMIHLVINIKFYQNEFTLKSKIGIIFLTFSIITTYVYLAFSSFNEPNFSFYYGLIFVSGAACITSVGLYGVIVVRKIPLGRSWFLLVTGIVIGTVADVWYYILELTMAYTSIHIVNLFWYTSYLMIFYALYKHYKTM